MVVALLVSGLRVSFYAQSVVNPVSISAAELAKLPRATTFTSVPAAPLDQDPFALTGGLEVHPMTPQVLYAAPGKRPIAVLPATELDEPTWVPAVLRKRALCATGWATEEKIAVAGLRKRMGWKRFLARALGELCGCHP